MQVAKTTLLVTCLTATATGQTIVNSIPHSGSFAGGVAYDAATNEVIVIDETANTVTFYDRVTGTQNSQFTAPGSLAIGGEVDISTGHLWIVTEGEIVYEVDRTGVILSQFPVTPVIVDASALTLDPCTDTVWVSNDSSNIVAEFTKTGTPTGAQFAPAGSTDGDGCTYDPVSRTFLMGEDTNNQILVVDRTGALIATIPVAALGISPEGLSLDPTTGSVFIANGFVAPIGVFEVTGIIAAPQPGASTHYGSTCGARIATSATLREDGLTCAGAWIGYAAGLPGGNFYGLNVGFARQNIPLGPIIGSSCTAYALNDVFGVLGQTNTDGRAGLRLPLPPGLPGLTLTFWGADLDLATLTLPSASDGLELIVQ